MEIHSFRLVAGKIVGYLLNPGHPKGRHKAILPNAIGFYQTRPEDLRQAIRSLIAEGRTEGFEANKLRMGRLEIGFIGALTGPPSDRIRSRRTWKAVIQYEGGWNLVTLKPLQE